MGTDHGMSLLSVIVSFVKLKKFEVVYKGENVDEKRIETEITFFVKRVPGWDSGHGGTRDLC